jgi:tetratricopeptide (TPR) repeat protein
MKFYIAKLYLTFLFLTCLSAISFAQDDTRAAAAWQVRNYDISATLPQNPSERSMSVKAALALQNVGNAAGSRITLRINSAAEVSAVRVNDVTATFTKGEERLGTSQRTIQRIVVSVPSVQPNTGTNILVEYALKVEENSGLNTLSPLGSQFLPLSFWYPTPNNHYAPKGADFAPFRLTVNAPSGETVVSSGTLTGNTFEQKTNGQPFFLTGSWEVVEAKGVTVYLPKGASDPEKQRATELANLAVEAKTYMASLLGNATEMPMRIVAVRQGAGYADAGTILLDYGAFRRPKIDVGTVMTLAESIAKIWIGNIRPVRGEGYGALREGLPLFAATQFLEKQYGKDTADVERMRQRVAYVSIARRDAPLNLMSPLDGTYYSSVANKGAMVWRVLAKQMGTDNFFGYVKTQDPLTIFGLRTTFSGIYPAIDYWLQNATDTNLMAGLPVVSGGETRVALRNTGGFQVNVNVTATTDKGEKLTVPVSIPQKDFAEAVFKTTAKIVRTEVDSDKLYPQLDYSDDVAPREFEESDPITVIKRAFDKQDFATAEKTARAALQNTPHFDETRTWLGRALLGQNKVSEADKEFKTALDEKLPTAYTQAWANLGLGDISLRANQNAQAAAHFDQAIRADAEYGSNLAARRGRLRVESGAAVDDTVKAFFVVFDKAILSGRKADVDSLIVPGEVSRFSTGAVSGQPSQWQTKILRTEKIDAYRTLVETEISVKRLGSELTESGTATFVLAKIGNTWKIGGIEAFEVR